MEQRIKTVVLPVAGLGTRFLPATKASPKEMLPIVDKPLIQYAAEEAVAAGAEQLVFITARNKRSIPDHFDKASELEQALQAQGKTGLANLVHAVLPPQVTCVYVHQDEPLGLGHAVLCAKSVVGSQPFAVILPDDLIYTSTSPGCLAQMCAQYENLKFSVVAVQQVPRARTGSYGIVTSVPVAERISRVTQIIEKPRPEQAPSTLGVVGRYVLSPRIFDYLEQIPRGSGGEIQLTDAIGAMLQQEPVLAYRFLGKRYDCGSKLGYLEATVEYGLRHLELGDAFSDYLNKGTWHDAREGLHAAAA